MATQASTAASIKIFIVGTSNHIKREAEAEIPHAVKRLPKQTKEVGVLTLKGLQMLTVTRRPGEQVVCKFTRPMPAGALVVVTIKNVDRNRVLIAIEADEGITIDRREVHDRKQAEEMG